MDIIILVCCVLIIILLIVNIVILLKKTGGGGSGSIIDLNGQTDQLEKFYSEGNKNVLDQISRQTDSVSGIVRQNVEILGDSLQKEQKNTRESVSTALNTMGKDIAELKKENRDSLDAINSIVTEKMQSTLTDRIDKLNDVIISNFTKLGSGLREEQSKQLGIINDNMQALRKENSESLDRINGTVNDKLQKTLDEKISQSFETVNKRLAEVYTGLGEMKNVANGVSDLQKILSNVKTRGIVGEIQLSAILADILNPSQYAEQQMIKKNSSERVDFAVKLPGVEEGKEIFLPIDSKFPGDTYQALVEAYESGDKALIDEKKKLLQTRLKGEAKSIRDKYISPPDTTEFAIMFLPFEGLYSEAVNMGMVELLQREYKVNIAGPSTMAALLNSLRMGFRTLAIQKKSGEVWSILNSVKKEFETFQTLLKKVQNNLRLADNNLEEMIGTRTRAINRQLDKITVADDPDAQQIDMA